MVSRNELETTVRNMVAFDILSKPLSSLGSKSYRRRDKLAAEAAELVEEEPKSNRFIAYVEEREEERARTIREGIEEFKKIYPEYGRMLEEMIKQTRVEKNDYFVFGIADGFKLAAEDYRRVMRDLGMSTVQADTMYPHLLDISDELGKARENTKRSILLWIFFI